MKNVGPRTLVYVQLSANKGNLKYAFDSGLRDALRDNFGQVVITAETPVQNLAIGVNSPKPCKASKKVTGTGYESSFCADDKIAALKQDGYRISSPGSIRRSINTSLSRTVYITINGLKYAWNIPKMTGLDTLLNALGIEEADVNDDLVFGASWPKPAVKSITRVNSGIDVNFASFCDPNRENSLGENWHNKKDRKSTDALSRT